MGLRVDKFRVLKVRLEQLEIEGSKHTKEVLLE